MFLLIPATGDKYEIDTRGNVRNAKTKRKIKPQKAYRGYYVRLYTKEKYATFSINQLLWEIHGQIPQRIRPPQVGVWIFKGTEIKYFETVKAASLYLSERIYYTKETIRKFLTLRYNEISGWKIKYKVEEARTLRTVDEILESKYFHRENRYWIKQEKNK